MKKRNNLYCYIFLVFTFFLLFSCKRIKEKGLMMEFNKNQENNVFEGTGELYEIMDSIKLYEDSISFMKKKIYNITFEKEESNSCVRDMRGYLKEDSLLFYTNLYNETNLIYSSYCGFSEGTQSEKLYNIASYKLNNLKRRTSFIYFILNNYFDNVEVINKSN